MFGRVARAAALMGTATAIPVLSAALFMLSILPADLMAESELLWAFLVCWALPLAMAVFWSFDSIFVELSPSGVKFHPLSREIDWEQIDSVSISHSSLPFLFDSLKIKAGSRTTTIALVFRNDRKSLTEGIRIWCPRVKDD